MVKVRFAPSPTGVPHIGNTRTALFNFLFARSQGGAFILRIEDTDRKRYIKEAEENIKEGLSWLSLVWDEEHRQSERLEIYKKHAQVLKMKGILYEDEGALRFKMPDKGKISWIDKVGNKNIEFDAHDQEDWVAIKSDGWPTYNFANVVDDFLMEITHVIRGEEFISSTPKHIALYDAFGWKKPFFAHLPLILGKDKSKLSKRHGAKSVLELREEGFLPEAVNNFMALLGWSPGENKEIMSVDEMIKLFRLEDINTSNPVFDETKLLWLNGEYVRKLSVSELKSKIKNQKSKTQIKDEKLLGELVELAQSRIKTLNEFYDLTRWIVEGKKEKSSVEEKEIIKKLKDRLLHIEVWNSQAILEVLKRILAEEKIRMPVVYKIFTGEKSGLPLPETLEIIGKEKALQILN